MQDDGVWTETVRRLDQRAHPKWDSLSWVALRPLIAAINDRINWVAPRLVLDLRTAWLARAGHTDPGSTYEGVVDRSDVTSFLLLGDTGEQDASQYIVGPALEAALFGAPNDPDATASPDSASPAAGGGVRPEFAVICSDIIYPSGDINDYIDGFYLPYERLLRPEAKPGRPQRIYALPGNHDWYDGLTGFMHTFCRQDELDASSYAWPSAATLSAARRGAGVRSGAGVRTWRERLHLEGVGRILWRRPSPPLAAPLHRGDQRTTLTALRDQLMPAPAPGTGQPGPYFAIQIDGLLVVCIDGGIGQGGGNSMIDADQGRWLIRVSQRPGPKILLTGYPLLVNGEWKLCLIDGAAAGLRDGSWTGPTTVGEIVATAAYGYVAAIGGDIHNFQHYRQRVGGDDGHIVTYLVSGGGGAYISATHPVPTAARLVSDRDDVNDLAIRAANAVRGGPPRPEDLSANAPDAATRAGAAHRALGPLPSTGAHAMIPAPALSLSHFSDEVLPAVWRFIRLMACFVIGCVAGTGVQSWAGRPAQAVMWTLLALVAAAVITRALLPGIAPSRRETGHRGRLHAYRATAGAVAAMSGAAAAIAAAQLGPANGRRYLAGWAVTTVVAAVLGTLQRRSGWWREPARETRPGARPEDPPRSTDRIVSSIGWGLLTLGLAALLLLLAFGPRRTTLWLAAAAVVLLATAVIGWRIRARPWWRGQSQNIALGVQLLAAVFVFSAAPGVHAAWRPLGVVAGGVLDVVVLLLAVTATCGGLVGVARLRWWWSGGDRWRIRVGRWGHVVPGLIALIVLVVLAGLTVLPRLGRAHQDAFAVFARSGLGTAWGLALLVIGVLGVDALRHRFPASYRWIATPAVALLIAAVLWGRAYEQWLATELVVLAIGWTLSVIAISAGYLAFLGGHNLVLDRPAHRDLEDRDPVPGGNTTHPPLLTLDQAEQVIEWRRTGEGGEQLDRVVRNRAKFVFPSTDQPRGIIQQKVSEFFSTDRPPFFQHFLTVRINGSVLEITPQVVTGREPVPGDTRATISIQL